jgi:CHAD domain-containing protein
MSDTVVAAKGADGTDAPDAAEGIGTAEETRTGAVVTELSARDRDQPAGRVFAMLLESHLQSFRAREAGVRSGQDPEDLHQFRVALRRARALLAVGHRVFPEEEGALLSALMQQFATLTSDVRDLDVLLEGFDGRVAELTPRLRTGAPELEARLRARLAASRSELLAAIDGDMYPVLLRRWQTLASVYRVGGGEPGPDARRAAGQVVDELLAHEDRRVRRQARRARRSDDVAEWHRLRKRVKRYRYAVSDVAPLCAQGRPKRLARALARLQDRLGELQDGVAIAEVLEAEGTRGGGPAALTAGALIERTVVAAEDDRERALAAWRHYDRPALRRVRAELRGD